jgi:predicted lipoprotein with Yx(FWY)xxD motif
LLTQRLSQAVYHSGCPPIRFVEGIEMSKILCIALLTWTLTSAAQAQSLQDAPLPVAISLIEENGAFKLRDGNGNSLYVLDRDPLGRSVCVGQCALEWPPVVAPQDAHRIGDWTPVHRTDGTMQWAYKGKPVYTFRGDTAAGQTNGAGRDGVWRLLAP